MKWANIQAWRQRALPVSWVPAPRRLHFQFQFGAIKLGGRVRARRNYFSKQTVGGFSVESILSQPHSLHVATRVVVAFVYSLTTLPPRKLLNPECSNWGRLGRPECA